jgi:hypothetical protein
MPRRGIPPRARQSSGCGRRTASRGFAWVGLNDEGPAGAQLQVGHQELAPHPADDQPSSLQSNWKASPRLELERHVGFGDRRPAALPPAPDEFGDPAVVAVKARRLQLGMSFSAVRRSRTGRRASVSSILVSRSANGAILVSPGTRRYFGSVPSGAFSQLPDRLPRQARRRSISDIVSPSR